MIQESHMPATRSSVNTTNRREALLDSLVGLAMASFLFIPVLRELTGVTDLVYVLPLGFLLGTLIIVQARHRVDFPFPTRVFVFFGIVFCMWLLVTSFWTVSSGQVNVDIVLVSYLMAILIVAPLMSTPAVLAWTLRSLIGAGLFTAWVVFMSHYQKGTLSGYGMVVSEFYLTASALLGASLVASVAYLSAARRVRLRHWIMIGVLLGGLALSLGRMSLLSSVALIVILALRNLLSRRQRRSADKCTCRAITTAVIALLIAAGLVWGGFQVERTRSRLERLFSSPVQELERGGRGRLWSTAWHNINSAPVFGHGLGSNGLLSSSSDTGYPHNLVLQVWLDAGIFGVLVAFVTLCVPLVVFWRRRRGEGARMALPFVVMYVFYAMQYQVSYNAYTARSVFLMGLLSTFAASYNWKQHSTGKAGAG
jgi:O-antigen ligase